MLQRYHYRTYSWFKVLFWIEQVCLMLPQKITRTCDWNLTGLKILTEHLCTQIQQLSIMIVTELFQTAQH